MTEEDEEMPESNALPVLVPMKEIKETFLSDKKSPLYRAKHGRMGYIRKAAVEEVSDQELLAEIAATDKDILVALSASRKIIDQNALINAVLKQKKDISFSIVSNVITEEDVLCKIAKSSDIQELAYLALSKITETSYVNEIAKSAVDQRTRQQAITRVDDDKILSQIILHEPDITCRGVAVTKTEDQSFLSHIVHVDRDIVVCRLALDQLTDQKLLSEIACGHRNDDICSVAAERIIDGGYLALIVLKSWSAKARRAAVLRLNDLSILSEVANNDEDDAVCAAAVHRMAQRFATAGQFTNVGEHSRSKAARQTATGYIRNYYRKNRAYDLFLKSFIGLRKPRGEAATRT